MSAIDKIKSHYESREIRSLDVPEWDMVIYSSSMTLAERDRIWAKAKKKESDFALYVYAIIEKAMDAQGKKLFTLEDKTALMNSADSRIVMNVGNWIISTDEENSKN